MSALEPIVGWIANLIQISVFIFTLWVLWRTRRQLKNALKRVQGQTSRHPVALIIGVGQDIEGAVIQYLGSINQSMPHRNYSRTGMVPNQKFYQILRDLLKIKQELTDAGVTEVHLFYMGPVTLAMALGAIFDNWVPVKLYKFQQGQYEFDFVLEKGTVLGVFDEIVSEGEETVVEKLMG